MVNNTNLNDANWLKYIKNKTNCIVLFLNQLILLFLAVLIFTKLFKMC